MTMLFDENYVAEAYENEIRQIALNEGREEGYAGAYISMVRRNLISKAVAANEMGISVAELEKIKPLRNDKKTVIPREATRRSRIRCCYGFSPLIKWQ